MKRFFHVALLLVTLTVFYTISLAQNPDGEPIGPGNEVHDQRAGSLLIYNYFTSSATGVSDTRITFTNTHQTQAVRVFLYFVDGATGQAPSSYLDLAPAQPVSFLMSEVDPGITGYLIAMATDDLGAPIPFDFLMGMAAITLASGHQATLGALAVPINPNNYYAALPRQLAMDQLPSAYDSLKPMLVINRIDGNLYTGMPSIGRLRCDLFNQAGARFSFNSRTLGPQARSYFYNLVTTGFTYNYIYNYLPAGQYGWLRMRPVDAGAITGAVLYFRESGGATAPYPGGYNLRHLTNTQAALEPYPGYLLQFGY